MATQPRMFDVPVVDRPLGPVERAVVSGSDVEAITAVLEKCARTIDTCTSARDIKALAITIIDGVSRRSELGGGHAPSTEGRGTPLAEVEARRVLQFGS